MIPLFYKKEICMNYKCYDIGLNLFCKQYKKPENIVKNALDNEIGLILTGSSMPVNKKIDDYIKKNKYVFGTTGIHPHNADTAKKEDFDEIKNLIKNNPNIVAVGECGLDYDRMFSTRENQIRCLEKHILLAEELNMPLFLHERSATDDFVKRFKNHKKIAKKSIVHCYTGDKYTLEKYLEFGFSIGITGWICDEKRGNLLRDAIKIIPLDKLLIETDAPYLTPKNVEGLKRVNVPENIYYVAKEISKLTGIDEKIILERTKENTENLFQIKKSL